jgi:hypothetical protein
MHGATMKIVSAQFLWTKGSLPFSPVFIPMCMLLVQGDVCDSADLLSEVASPYILIIVPLKIVALWSRLTLLFVKGIRHSFCETVLHFAEYLFFNRTQLCIVV